MTREIGPISVVIPTYNRAEFLGAAIRSAFEQPNTGEVIVVDDGSTDGTQEVLRGFPGVRTFRLANRERGAARNFGANEARFEYLAFLDSDDTWEPVKLAAQLEHPEYPSVTGIRFIDACGEPTGRTYVPPEHSWIQLPFENNFLATPSSLLVPRSIFRATGGFPEERNVQGSEDWLFLNRLRAIGAEIVVIPELLTCYRVHPGNSTGQLDKVADCMWNAAELIAGSGSRGFSRRVKGRTAGSIARQFARWGRWEEARRWYSIARTEGTLQESWRATWAVASSGAKCLFAQRKKE